jgi:hypothetical protein
MGDMLTADDIEDVISVAVDDDTIDNTGNLPNAASGSFSQFTLFDRRIEGFNKFFTIFAKRVKSSHRFSTGRFER